MRFAKHWTQNTNHLLLSSSLFGARSHESGVRSFAICVLFLFAQEARRSQQKTIIQRSAAHTRFSPHIRDNTFLQYYTQTKMDVS